MLRLPCTSSLYRLRASAESEFSSSTTPIMARSPHGG
jgi:hypothetical protein